MDCFTRDINCNYIQELISFNGRFSKNRLNGYPGVTKFPGVPEKNDIPSLISFILQTKLGLQNGTCNGTANKEKRQTAPCQGPVHLFYITLGRNMHCRILLLRFSRIS
jgi:hypothetical protein